MKRRKNSKIYSIWHLYRSLSDSWISSISIAAAVAVLFSLSGSLVTFFESRKLTLKTENQFSTIGRFITLDGLESVRKTDERLTALEKKIDSLAANLGNATDAQLKNAGLEQKLGQLDNMKDDLGDLKRVILDNPSKALSLLLIQKDIAEVQKRQADLALATQAEITRIYDFSKWFLALMITLAVGLVTMGFIRRAK
jgi:hypothetical protein